LIRLGSNSKTRANILNDFDINFIQNGSDFDEDLITTKSAKSFVVQATMGKYNDLKNIFDDNLPLLVADTVVCVDDEILRKPKDLEDAKNILNLQSGNYVKIITYMIYSKENLFFEDLSNTIYKFEKFHEKDVNDYLSTNLWQDKAGACMVEGFCKKYIKSQIGLTSTAMGLSIEKLKPFL
jgi:septum formation protein